MGRVRRTVELKTACVLWPDVGDSKQVGFELLKRMSDKMWMGKQKHKKLAVF